MDDMGLDWKTRAFYGIQPRGNVRQRLRDVVVGQREERTAPGVRKGPPGTGR